METENKITLGRHSYMGSFNNNYGVRMKVGNFSCIANGFHMVGAEHPSQRMGVVSNFDFHERFHIDEYPKCATGQEINIGNDVWIGENVLMIAPVTVYDGAIIGAGSVVASDVAAYGIYYGNPCKFHGYRFNPPEPIISKLLKIKWWDWTDNQIVSRMMDMIDINNFLNKYGTD